jgi:integrase
LTVSDVTDGNGGILERARARQRKTHKHVCFNIVPAAQVALRVHIAAWDLAPHDYLFTAARRKCKRPLTSQAFRNLVRRWADAAGHRDTSRFAGHTTRRTLAVAIYNKTRNVAAVSRVLGHSSLHHTQNYLGVSDEAALTIARDCAL